MLGFSLPQFGVSAEEEIGEFASRAEQLGADSFWVGDRLLAAQHPSVGYRGSDEVPAEFRRSMDPFVALTVAASATARAVLGTSVLVAPFYSPLLLARQLTSIDVVSRGRLAPGFGLGWSPEEYQAAGAPFTDRGAQLDELLDVLSAAWAPDQPVIHQGPRWSIPPAWISLKPARKPHPPIYLSAFRPAALRRIGKRADGWLPVVSLPGPVDLEGLARDRRVIDDSAVAAGRAPGDIHTYVRMNLAANTAIEDVTAAIRTLADSGYADVSIDLLFVADSNLDKLHWVEQIIGSQR
ncbi:LLM class F420-dependent oxidoreductase [Mycolicibacterium conceptionense]|uniref:LLM class F420-dependent oxidoreductase n=2 Tax=Mycolicibacterium conceptionense TaxID=451644 RepID=A0ABX3V4N7_9MYCO|nr:TIGR03619 family F420-dependent LLM class oxidoreductase [Mycolicibacterium conceptionense]ORV24660.1 LLM class F420-dependent oxidoreductase [Mycolicibacterium conceptionense]